MEVTLEQVRQGLDAATYVTTPRVETALSLDVCRTRRWAPEHRRSTASK